MEMARYEPSSRRPIAGVFRQTARAVTARCVRLGIHPDVISCLSIVAAAAGAIGFWKSGKAPWLLIGAPLFCYLRLWFNMLDGMVAVASGQASSRGEIMNDLPDRISDVIIFAGVAHSGLMNPILGYWAAIAALLTAYVGIFGQALGGRREFSGLMSKPWRMVALHLGAWTTFVCLHRANATFGRLTIFDWTCLIVIAGCVQTISIRLKRIMESLEDKTR